MKAGSTWNRNPAGGTVFSLFLPLQRREPSRRTPLNFHMGRIESLTEKGFTLHH